MHSAPRGHGGYGQVSVKDTIVGVVPWPSWMLVAQWPGTTLILRGGPPAGIAHCSSPGWAGKIEKSGLESRASAICSARDNTGGGVAFEITGELQQPPVTPAVRVRATTANTT